jgi:hypothetical protein
VPPPSAPQAALDRSAHLAQLGGDRGQAERDRLGLPARALRKVDRSQLGRTEEIKPPAFPDVTQRI